MRAQAFLDLVGIHLQPTAVDHVAHAAFDPHEAVVVDAREVAGAEPAVVGHAILPLRRRPAAGTTLDVISSSPISSAARERAVVGRGRATGTRRAGDRRNRACRCRAASSRRRSTRPLRRRARSGRSRSGPRCRTDRGNGARARARAAPTRCARIAAVRACGSPDPATASAARPAAARTSGCRARATSRANSRGSNRSISTTRHAEPEREQHLIDPRPQRQRHRNEVGHLRAVAAARASQRADHRVEDARGRCRGAGRRPSASPWCPR